MRLVGSLRTEQGIYDFVEPGEEKQGWDTKAMGKALKQQQPQQLSLEVPFELDFNEADHPRGHEGNPGQFTAKGEATTAAPSPAEKPVEKLNYKQAVLQEAKGIKVTDKELEHNTRGEGSIGRRDYDEIEGTLSSDEQSELEEFVRGRRESAFEDYEGGDIDLEEVAKDADWDANGIHSKATDLVDQDYRSWDEQTKLIETIDGWYENENGYGTDAMDDLVSHLKENDAPQNFIDRVQKLRHKCDQELEDRRTEAEDAERDEAMRNYDEDDDKHEWLTDFWDNHQDESRFSGEGDPDDENKGVWGKDSNGDPLFYFQTKAGDDYSITSYDRDASDEPGKKLPILDVQFQDSSGSYDRTDAGSAKEVFHKVCVALVGLAINKNMDAMSFMACSTPAKQNTKVKEPERSRKRLYDRLVKTVASALPEYAALAVEQKESETGRHSSRNYLIVKRDKMPEYRDALMSRFRTNDTVDVLLSLQGDFQELQPEVRAEWFTPAGWALELDVSLELAEHNVEDESRDDHGRWTRGGGAGAKAGEEEHHWTKGGVSFVAPNEENVNFGVAERRLDSKRQQGLTKAFQQIDSMMGLKERTTAAIGAWPDSGEGDAENSTMCVYDEHPSWEELKASAMMKGSIANQKQVLVFQHNNTGDHTIFHIRVASNDLGALHEDLLQRGIAYHTITKDDEGVHVYVFAMDHTSDQALETFWRDYHAGEPEVDHGTGEFLPGETTGGNDKEQRANSRAYYEREIGSLPKTRLEGERRGEWEKLRHYWYESPIHEDTYGQEGVVRASLQPQFLDVPFELAFDPDEARDEHGKWTALGGSSKHQELKAEILKQYPPANPHGHTSESRYTDAKGKYTPERQKLHHEIIEAFMKGKTPVKHPIAHMMGGGPGSGKSTLKKSGIIPMPKNCVDIDPDHVKDFLPEYKLGLKADDPAASEFVQREASHISNIIADRAARGKYNLILDATGDHSLPALRQRVFQLRQGGAPVIAHYATVPVKVAVDRARVRAEQTGRYVPKAVITHKHASVSRVFARAVTEALFDAVELFETSGPKPVRVVQAARNVLKVVRPELWEMFLKKAQEK